MCVYLINLSSSRPIRFGVSLPYREREENKENSKPKEVVRVAVNDDDDDDSDSEEGPVLYKDEDNDDNPGDASKYKLHTYFQVFPLKVLIAFGKLIGFC